MLLGGLLSLTNSILITYHHKMILGSVLFTRSRTRRWIGDGDEGWCSEVGQGQIEYLHLISEKTVDPRRAKERTGSD